MIQMSNDTGIKPINFQILLKIKKEEEKTKAGIILPKSITKANDINQQVGEIIDMGCNAFKDEKWEVMPDSPCIGDSVMITRHAGIDIHNDDEYLYRMCSSDEVKAKIEKNSILNQKQ